MALARTVSASQAGNYYYECDPVTSPEGRGENSDWCGELQKDLNLEGKVGAREFQSLLAGTDPKDAKLLVKEGVNHERRAGIDLAFSAPKSVSIVALHLGDERILEAHRQAVQKALKYVESNLIQYRERDFAKNKIVHIKSENMISATFMHSTSRANDPQLHTHSVILNITKTADGKYKAISNELIFRNQKLINNIYQNELAQNIKALGYGIDNYDNKFEISGVSTEAIEAFSKRTTEIDKKYEKLLKKYPDLTEAEVRDIAVLSSRDSKSHELTKEELKAKWEEEYSKIKIIPDKNKPEIKIDNKTVIDNAVNEITESESTFNKRQFMNVLINQNKGQYDLKQFTKLIDEAILNKQITLLGEKNEEAKYSTKEMIKIENDIISIVQKGKASINPILEIRKASELNNNSKLTVGQKEFIEHILTTKDKINIVQGDAGTGKTYAVNRLREIIETEQPDKKIIGLGFTGKAAQELSSAAKIETSTIASFLASEKDIKNSIIIVDEASMVSSKDMLNVINKAQDNRIVFIGDCKQLQAIGAGKMFAELQNEKVVKMISMEEVLRQKTENTKQIVKHIKQYSDGSDDHGIKKALSILKSDNSIVEITTKSKTQEATKLAIKHKAVEEYIQDPDSLILVSSRAEKNALNQFIRTKILTEEQKESSKMINIREQISANQFLASSYKAGDKIVLNKQEGTVKKIDIMKNIIELEVNNKKQKTTPIIQMNPMNTEFAAYRELKKDFTAGDKILFTRNDKAIGVQNGLSGTIEKIDNFNNIYVKTKDKRIIFNTDNYSYLDHGYAQTLHKAQGQTTSNAILIHNDSDNISTESFYVAATRATNSFKIITSSEEKLYNSIIRHQEKSSTRDFKDVISLKIKE